MFLSLIKEEVEIMNIDQGPQTFFSLGYHSEKQLLHVYVLTQLSPITLSLWDLLLYFNM